MAESAAKLVDRVLPEVPVRQWVLAFPFPLRFPLARGPALTAAVRRIFLRGVFAFHELESPTDEELAGILQVIGVRILRQLEARGLLDRKSDRFGPADSAEQPPLLALFDAAFAPPSPPAP